LYRDGYKQNKTPEYEDLLRAVEELKPKLLIIDPLVSCLWNPLMKK